MRPAIKIIFAPLNNRHKVEREKGLVVDGKTTGRTIWLDPRSISIGETLLHELIHMRKPSLSEAGVIAETKLRWKKMSWKEKARLLTMLGHAVLEGQDTVVT